jgi:Ca2+-transporting ATPase
MDLAASATFVAEPEETGSMQKPPIDPKEKFLNTPMLRRLFLGAISLFIAVSATFLFAWYTTSDITYARTIAFAAWMFGHIFLALNFRSEREPLIKEGLLSNKVMLLWAIVVFVTLILGTSLPVIQTSLQITSLRLQDWVLVIAGPFVATFWMELAKILHKSA